MLAIEAASGVLLLVVAVVALVWANSAWSRRRTKALWHTAIGGRVGSWAFERPLHFWVNDG